MHFSKLFPKPCLLSLYIICIVFCLPAWGDSQNEARFANPIIGHEKDGPKNWKTQFSGFCTFEPSFDGKWSCGFLRRSIQ